ncbi:MAG TPA: type II toxin-antitoxin system RatA family toxin [Gammaproteobacteria bacterium]|nr:type II toxin-antitoxin system RatA family toxin [Gammaproteobacteria bacterium]
MPTIHRSAQVPYEAAQMFDLVNDVEAYPEFLQWCRAARIVGRGEGFVDAALDIGIGGIYKSFTTRNSFERPQRLQIDLVSGPFRHLDGLWEFRSLERGGSEVSLSLTFEVVRSPFSVVFSMVFEELARAQMAAFVHRAEALYDKK